MRRKFIVIINNNSSLSALTAIENSSGDNGYQFRETADMGDMLLLAKTIYNPQIIAYSMDDEPRSLIGCSSCLRCKSASTEILVRSRIRSQYPLPFVPLLNDKASNGWTEIRESWSAVSPREDTTFARKILLRSWPRS